MKNLQDIINNEIFSKYHLPLIKQKVSDKYFRFLTPQESYGVLSACRRAAFVRIFYNILVEIHPDLEELITTQEVLYLQITALFAHSVWENKLNDEGILAIKTNCTNFLKRIGATPATADQFARLLEPNDVNVTNLKHHWLKDILKSADTLNDMRKAHSIFSLECIPLTAELDKANKQFLIEEVAKNTLDLMKLQQDISFNGVQILREEATTIIHEINGKNPNKKVKRHYEQANNCYELVIKDIKKFPTLSQYYKKDDLPTYQVNLIEDLKSKERNLVRHAAPTIQIKDDFLIKSLRGDNANYFLQFVDGVIPPHTHHPLRFDNKKKYTVDGAGVHLRSAKTPLYSKEEKQGYSKKQSVTYCMPDFQPNPFNFSGETVKTVGVLFLNTKNALLSDHLLTRDSGSCVRPNDFDFEQSAERYYKLRVNKYLFAKNKLEAFKSALQNDKDFKYHNEVLAHLSFTADDNCLLFINVDTLAARLLAQTYAKILSSRLINTKKCSSDYEVKICYYMPESFLHLKEYTKEEQEMDQLEAKEILLNEESLTPELLKNNFEYLFFLSPQLLLEHLNQPVNTHSLTVHLLTQGYFHILDFCVELDKIKAHEIEQLIVDQIEKVTDSETLLQIAFHALKKGNFLIFKQTLMLMSAQADSAKYVNEISPIYKCNLLQLAFQLQKTDYIDVLRQLNHLNVEQTDENGNTVLHYAVSTDKESYVQLAFELGADSNAVNKNGFTALHYAIANGYYNIVRFLLNRPDFDRFDDKAIIAKNTMFSESVSLLEMAAMQDEVEVLKILHEDGRFDFSKEYAYERTLLSVAEDNPLNLMYLLTLPEINFKKKDMKHYMGGKNALHKAAQRGDVDVVKALLEKGMPINETSTDSKQTSLHYAVKGSYKDGYSRETQIEIIKLLLNAGIDRNALSEPGAYTALDLAIEEDNPPLVKFLIENGCKANSKLSLLDAALFSKDHMFFKFFKYELQNKGKNFLTFFKPAALEHEDEKIKSDEKCSQSL